MVQFDFGVVFAQGQASVPAHLQGDHRGSPLQYSTKLNHYYRDYFKEFVDIVLLAWQKDTFSYRGKFWTIPPDDFVNLHPHPVYTRHGQGVSPDMRISEIGIAPKPLQRPHPPLYGGFTHSMSTALFWAQYGGRPVVLSSNLEFCQKLWAGYRTEAAKHGRQLKPGDETAWGGVLVVAPENEQAQEWAKDGLWFWDTWSNAFGQDFPELLIGDPDSISRRIEVTARAVAINEWFFLIPQGIHRCTLILTFLELFATKVMPRFP